uniref:RteC protein n=1 Tax=Prevotella sp. GTC17253 TaxID=3236793 RepID=A0AB33IRL1_9BACT
MANKRVLKRTINYICSDLFSECIAASLYNGHHVNRDNLDALLSSIIVIHSDYIRRISHVEPGMKSKAYFKSLIRDFNKQIDEVIDQINNLG